MHSPVYLNVKPLTCFKIPVQHLDMLLFVEPMASAASVAESPKTEVQRGNLNESIPADSPTIWIALNADLPVRRITKIILIISKIYVNIIYSFYEK